MSLIYIGIDPEPSGAYCLMDGERVEFGTSYPDIGQRITEFGKHLASFETNNVPNDTIFFIEKIWGFPSQSVQSVHKLSHSAGAWEAIANIWTVRNIPEGKQVYLIPAITWKNTLTKYFKPIGPDGEPVNLGKDKDISLGLVEDLLPIEIVRKYLVPKQGVNKKQVTDRCEAFLIALFGRLYINGELSNYKVNLEEG